MACSRYHLIKFILFCKKGNKNFTYAQLKELTDDNLKALAYFCKRERELPPSEPKNISYSTYLKRRAAYLERRIAKRVIIQKKKARKAKRALPPPILVKKA